MRTALYAQWQGGSVVDAIYLGTVDSTAESVAAEIRSIKGVTATIYHFVDGVSSVIAWKQKLNSNPLE